MSGETFEWRGPAPYVFLPVEGEALDHLLEHVSVLSYGWGCIRAVAALGKTRWETALMPKDGGYLIPLKLAVQRAEGIAVGDHVSVQLDVAEPQTAWGAAPTRSNRQEREVASRPPRLPGN